MDGLPLTGVRVIDLTRGTNGPFCTRLLADYGADVVKVEEPAKGDPARTQGPFYHDEPGLERSGFFLFLNTNKRSITLDVASERGRQVVKDLARDADIIVENFGPGVMDGMGLGYAALAEINPRLVMTSLNTFGEEGPYRDWNGTDLTVWAMSGNMIVTGDPEKPPVKPAGHIPSYIHGYMAALATAIALFAAEASGEGEHLDVPFFEAVTHNIDGAFPRLMGYQYTGKLSKRRITGSNLGVGSGVYPCADGYFYLVCGALRFPGMARMIGAEHLLTLPEWATVAARSGPERADDFEVYLVPWLLERTKKEIRSLCQEYGVLGAPMNTLADLLDDEHFQERGFFQEIDHPSTGPLQYPGYHFTLHMNEPMPARRRAPLLGEHTVEILSSELGYSAGHVERLHQEKVI